VKERHITRIFYDTVSIAEVRMRIKCILPTEWNAGVWTSYTGPCA